MATIGSQATTRTTLESGKGDDTVTTLGGSDRLDGGPGEDSLNSGVGADEVRAADGAVDAIVCGGGTDSLTVDPIDTLDPDCTPPPPPPPADPPAGGSSDVPPAPRDEPAPPSPEPISPRAPAVTAFSAAPRRFRPATADAGRRAGSGGTTFRYALSADAAVAITIERLETGRKAGKRCAKRRRGQKGRKCTRAVRVTTLTKSSKVGADSIAFTGRVGRRALPAGRYRATIVATGAEGAKSQPRSVGLTIIR
jgi:hypothetical protein